MAKRRQLKRSECNEEPPATKVAMCYKEKDENNTTIQRKLNKKIIYIYIYVPFLVKVCPKL